MHVFRDIYFEKSCISDSYKAHQPTEKNALLPHNKRFFKTIPKSQFSSINFLSKPLFYQSIVNVLNEHFRHLMRANKLTLLPYIRLM